MGAGGTTPRRAVPGARHASNARAAPPGSSAPAGSWRDLIRLWRRRGAADGALGVATLLPSARHDPPATGSILRGRPRERSPATSCSSRAQSTPGRPRAPTPTPPPPPPRAAPRSTRSRGSPRRTEARVGAAPSPRSPVLPRRLASATEPAARVDSASGPRAAPPGAARTPPLGGGRAPPRAPRELLRRGRAGKRTPLLLPASSSSADADTWGTEPLGDRETSRHALNAIGALVTVPRGRRRGAARVAVGGRSSPRSTTPPSGHGGSQSQVSQFRKSARGGSPWTPSPAGTSPPSRGARTCARRRTARAERSRRGRIASSRPWSRTSLAVVLRRRRRK